MVEYQATGFYQLVIDEGTYYQNKQEIDEIWEKCKFKYYFLGIQYLIGYTGQVFVWLIPADVKQYLVQEISDDITYICMDEEAAE